MADMRRRFYDLDGGHILCNGKDIKDMNVYAYRKHLSLVAQEATLFKGKNYAVSTRRNS